MKKKQMVNLNVNTNLSFVCNLFQSEGLIIDCPYPSINNLMVQDDDVAGDNSDEKIVD